MTSNARSVSGLVTDGSTGDFYSFILDNTETVNLHLTVPFGQAYEDVFTSTAQNFPTYEAVGSASSDGWIYEILQPGTYYVEVSATTSEPADSTYTLTASLGSPSTGTQGLHAGGASIQSPTALGTLSATPTVEGGWVGTSQEYGWYSFSITSLSNVQYNVSGVSGSGAIQVDLTNASGGFIRNGLSGNTVLEPLAVGTYFIEVLGDGTSSEGYNLSIDAVPETNTAGQSIATAASIGTLSQAGTSVVGHVGTADTVDYFAFTVPTASYAQFTLSGMTQAASITLLNASGGEIASASPSASSSTTTQLIQSLATLPAGSTYYVEVSSESGDTNFTLTASETPIVASGGTSAAAAVSIGTLSTTPLDVSGYVGSADTLETYKFVLTSAATVNIAVDANYAYGSSEVEGTLLNSSGGTVQPSISQIGWENEIGVYVLQAGTYTEQITPVSSNSDNDYTLSFYTGTPQVASSSVDNSGSSLAGAVALGTLSATPMSEPEWVGSTSSVDLFSFTLATASQVNIVLAGLATNTSATVSILNQSGAQQYSDSALSTEADALTPELAAGTYYIKVNSSYNTGYNLSASAAALPQIAGATIATAKNIGALGGASQTFTGFVGTVAPTQTNDFEFTLAATSTVNLTLSGLSPDAIGDIQLTNISNTLLAASRNSVIATLQPGTYFAEVIEEYGPTTYTLTANATPIADVAGSTLSSAVNSFGTLDGAAPGVSVAAAIAQAQAGNTVSISDTSANVFANLAALESYAAAGVLIGIAFTNANPDLTFTGAQLRADSAALALIKSSYAELVFDQGAVSGSIDLGGATTLIGIGSTGSEAIQTSSGGNLLFLGGAATSLTSLGADTIVAGAGAETVNASGNALYFGGAGSTLFQNGAGATTVVGSSGGNTITGGSGSMLYFGGSTGGSVYTGGSGVDTIVGFGGGLTATGGANGSVIFAGAGATNSVNTGPGQSTVVSFGSSDNIVVTGAGNDAVEVVGAASTVNASSSSGADDIFLFGSNEQVLGGSGTEGVVVESAARNTTLTAGTGGSDYYIYTEGSGASRTVDFINFSASDAVYLQYYSSGVAAAALSSATTSGGSEIVTLTDNTTLVFQNFTGLKAANFGQL